MISEVKCVPWGYGHSGTDSLMPDRLMLEGMELASYLVFSKRFRDGLIACAYFLECPEIIMISRGVNCWLQYAFSLSLFFLHSLSINIFCETLRWSSNTGIAAGLLMMFTYKFAGIANAVTLAYLFITNYIKRSWLIIVLILHIFLRKNT